jgi:hypothetical protein
MATYSSIPKPRRKPSISPPKPRRRPSLALPMPKPLGFAEASQPPVGAIQQSLIAPPSIAPPAMPMGFAKASRPQETDSFESDFQRSPTFIGASEMPEEANSLVGDMGFSPEDWTTYKDALSVIESAGKYNIAGGSGDHYDGRYQMGRGAKTDAARQLRISDPGHDAPAREAFRNDPVMQENFLAGFTKANHRYLMRNSTYRNASPQRKLQILGYAHNQGMGGANKWLNTGKVGVDGFGTEGTKYTESIKAAFKAKLRTEATDLLP